MTISRIRVGVGRVHRSGPAAGFTAQALIRKAFSGAVAALVLTSQVHAQQAPAPTGEQAPGLEEVVVSAQRRTENLQTTPIAITAISGALLESRNLDNITDVGAFVPNTVIQPLGAG